MNATDSSPAPFSNMTELMRSHESLSARENDPSAAVEIAHFIGRAKATGRVMAAKRTRAEARTIINYWYATLIQLDRERANSLRADTLDEFVPTCDGAKVEALESEDEAKAQFQESFKDKAKTFDRELDATKKSALRRLLLQLFNLSDQFRDPRQERVTSADAIAAADRDEPLRVQLPISSNVFADKGLKDLAEQLVATGLLKREAWGGSTETDAFVLANQSLFQTWPSLHRVADERRAIRDLALGWERSSKDPSALLNRGAQMDKAEDYQDLNELEKDFLARSRTTNRKHLSILLGMAILVVMVLAILAGKLWLAKNDLAETLNQEKIQREQAEESTALAKEKTSEAEQNARAAQSAKDRAEELAGKLLLAKNDLAESLNQEKIQREEAEKSMALSKEKTSEAEQNAQAAQSAKDRAEKQAEEFSAKAAKLSEQLAELTKKLAVSLPSLRPDGPELLLIKSVTQNATALQQDFRDPLIGRLTGHRAGINQGVFSADGRRIATASADKTVNIWTFNPTVIERGARVILESSVVASSSKGGVRTATFVPNTDYLITGSSGQSVRVFRWQGTEKRMVAVAQSDATGDAIMHMEFNPVDNTMAVVSREDGSCKLLKMPSPEPKTWLTKEAVLTDWHHSQARPGKPMSWASFSRDGSAVVTSSDDGKVGVWSASAPFEAIPDSFVGNPADCKAPTRKMIFSPVDNLTVAGGSGTKVVLWRVGSGKILRLLDQTHGGIGHNGGVVGVAFSPDGKLLASIATDGQCLIWDTSTLKAYSVPVGIRGRLLGVDWKRDYLAIVGEDGGLEIWNCSAPEKPKRLFAEQAHTGTAWGVTFSPDGKQLLTWSGTDQDTDNLPSAKGTAAEWSKPGYTMKSDYTAALWDVDVAVRSGPTTRSVVAAPAEKAQPIPIDRINDGRTRAVPTKDGLFVWVGKINNKDQKAVRCSVFTTAATPASYYSEADMEKSSTFEKLSAKLLNSDFISTEKPLVFTSNGKTYELVLKDLVAGLWKNDHVNLELREK